MGLVKYVVTTSAKYNALVTKDNDTLYFIQDSGQSTGKLYKGATLISDASGSIENITIDKFDTESTLPVQTKVIAEQLVTARSSQLFNYTNVTLVNGTVGMSQFFPSTKDNVQLIIFKCIPNTQYCINLPLNNYIRCFTSMPATETLASDPTSQVVFDTINKYYIVTTGENSNYIALQYIFNSSPLYDIKTLKIEYGDTPTSGNNFYDMGQVAVENMDTAETFNLHFKLINGKPVIQYTHN